RFFSVRLEGAAVGCGAVGFDDGFAELKRMYVLPAMRGRGVVQALLARLETEAVAHGYRRLMLETGDTLLPALRVYERAGFRRCGAFGHYAVLEPHRIVRSVFMEKSIG
ncbi:MAG: GNAT family N-acetyltransferase, partial [Micropepsaceae bacterium]